MQRLLARITFILIAASIGMASADLTPNGVPVKPDDRTIVHVLNRIGFGPVPGDIDRVRHLGLSRYIDQQLRPDRLADDGITARLARFETLGKNSRELAGNFFLPAKMERRRGQQAESGRSLPSPDGAAAPDKRAMRTPQQAEAVQRQRQVLAELAQHKVLRAAYSSRQLEEVMVDFWFNHFNVFAGKGQTRVYLTEYERDAIRPRVFGKFRDLLGATAQSPAMLFYLDNWQSSAPAGAQSDEPQRMNGFRMARRRDTGTAAAAASSVPANRRPRGLNENYARELMELHTLGVEGGYTQKDVQEVARAFTGWTIANPRQSGGFRYDPRMHDDGEKIVLGQRIEGGGGQRDGERVLDILAGHPATSRFIAMKLARRFVSDQPPAPLVERAATTFRKTGGDIRETVRAIITSPEFFDATAYRAKVKTPFEFLSSALRAAKVDASGALPLVQAMRDLGMPLYQCQPPTGYADRADAWVNTGALLNRMNFAVSLTGGRLRGVGAGDASQDTIVAEVLAGDVSEATRSIVSKAAEPAQAVALLLGSPEFQRR